MATQRKAQTVAAPKAATPTRRTPKGVSPAVVWSAMAGTTLLVIASFILSFAALTDLARRAGIYPDLAFLWPLIVDGLIVVATAAIIALAGHPKRVTWFPWVLLFGGAGVSVAGNAAHAVLSVESLEDGFPMAVAASVAAVPPIVLLAVTHLMVVLIQNQATTAKPAKAAPKKAKADQPKPEPVKPKARQSTAVQPEPAEDTAATVQEAPASVPAAAATEPAPTPSTEPPSTPESTTQTADAPLVEPPAAAAEEHTPQPLPVAPARPVARIPEPVRAPAPEREPAGV